jgi:superfamily II DNA or RNA helicase
MNNKNNMSYDYLCFSTLAYEFDFSDKKTSEEKIKRKLRHHKLAKYDQKRVEYIRNLKNELLEEISTQTKSKYFQKSKSNFAELTDFDINKMQSDYLEKYKEINEEDMFNILNFTIYLYHMR